MSMYNPTEDWDTIEDDAEWDLFRSQVQNAPHTDKPQITNDMVTLVYRLRNLPVKKLAAGISDLQ